MKDFNNIQMNLKAYVVPKNEDSPVKVPLTIESRMKNSKSIGDLSSGNPKNSNLPVQFNGDYQRRKSRLIDEISSLRQSL